MKYYMALLSITLLFLAACAPQEQPEDINSFEECVAAGNPIMESYPRQCRANGQTFVEDIEKPEPTQTVTFSECPEERPEVCTLQYDPVCTLKANSIRCITEPCPSFDAVTGGNACTACSDEETIGFYKGECKDNRFVICKDAELKTGFNIEQLAQENGWICLDICPNNYDPYTTQIGAEMCIEHYGVEEIESWNTCERSSETCDCVKAYETTDNQQIENTQFRCVPEQYAERLLFRGGQERLDEDGESSVVIA